MKLQNPTKDEFRALVATFKVLAYNYETGKFKIRLLDTDEELEIRIPEQNAKLERQLKKRAAYTRFVGAFRLNRLPSQLGGHDSYVLMSAYPASRIQHGNLHKIVYPLRRIEEV